MRYLTRVLTGAMAGGTTALMAFALLDFVLITDRAIRRGELPGRSPGLILAISAAGAITGGALTGSRGMVRVGGAARDVVLGVLAGVAIVVALGLVTSSSFGPKQAEAEKAKWLLYGVPAGALAGGTVGAARGWARRKLVPDHGSAR